MAPVIVVEGELGSRSRPFEEFLPSCVVTSPLCGQKLLITTIEALPPQMEAPMHFLDHLESMSTGRALSGTCKRVEGEVEMAVEVEDDDGLP